MRAKIIKKLPAPSNFFDLARVYIGMMNTEVLKSEMKRMINQLFWIFWPFSPKKLQPIKVVSPTSLLPRDDKR